MPVMDENGQWVDEETGETLAPVGNDESLSAEQVSAINQPPSGAKASPTPADSLAPDLKTRLKQLSELQMQKIKEQEEQLKEKLREIQAYKRAPGQVDLSALMSVVDTWTGSKLAQSYRKPETASERFAKATELETQLMRQQNDLLGKDAKLLAQLGGGGMTPYQQQRIEQANRRLGIAEDEQAKRAGDIIDKDPQLKQLNTQNQRIEIGKHTLDSTPVLTPQLFNEIQLDIANAISGGRAAAVSTQKQVEFNSYAIEWQKFKQKLDNNPQDIASPEVKKYIREVLERLGESYAENMSARAKQIGEGRQYRGNKAAQKTLDTKVKSFTKPKASAPTSGLKNPEDMTDEELAKELGK